MHYKKMKRVLAAACAAAVTASGFCPAAPVMAEKVYSAEDAADSSVQPQASKETEAEDSTENMVLYWSDDLEETTAVSGTAANYWSDGTAAKNWTGLWQAKAFTNEKAVISLDRETFASGSQSVHYSSTDASGRISVSLGSALQNVDFTKNYILRARVKAENVTADGADITVDTSAAAGESFELTLSYDAEKPETAVSTALLEYAIELAKDADLTDVVPAVVEKFNAALANAEEIVEQVKAGDTSVTQEMVDESWQELVRAMQYLSFKQGDKTDLNKVIAMAESLDLDRYLLAGQDVFAEALSSAEAVAADENAMEKEIEEAWRELLAAMGNLRLKPDKGLLEELISQAQSVDTEAYTEESVQALTAALADAAAVFDNDQADKEQVEEAQSALKAALAGLTAKTEAGGSDTAGADTDTGNSGTGTAGSGNGTESTEAGGRDTGSTGSGSAGIVNSSADRAVKTGDSSPAVPLYAAAAALALACAAGSGLGKQADRGRKESKDKE